MRTFAGVDIPMPRLVRALESFAALIISVLVAGVASASDSPLLKLASSRFLNLTHAERALLEFVLPSVGVHGVIARVERVGTDFTVNQARFGGNAGSPSGLNASLASVKGLFTWQDVSLSNSAELDLRGASLNQLLPQERSWPSPGNLALDGLTYSGLVFPEPMVSSSEKTDAALRWLALQPLAYIRSPIGN